MFEILGCFFFNSIWIAGSAACYFLLRYAFTFVAFPHWLEGGIIAALSFWVGLMGMSAFMDVFVNKSGRAECLRMFKWMALMGLSILATCIFAAAFYVFLSRYELNGEAEKWIVGLSSSALWATGVSGWINKSEQSEQQAKNETHANSKQPESE
jgi:hypothetical protein